MIEIELGHGTVAVAGGTLGGRRFVAFTPQRQKMPVGAHIPITGDDKFDDLSVVFWIDDASGAKVASDAFNIATRTAKGGWQHVKRFKIELETPETPETPE